MNKDIIDGKFISVDEDEKDNANNVEGQGDNIEVEPSLEEVFEPL